MSLFNNFFGSTPQEETNSKINWLQLTVSTQLDEIEDASNSKLVLIFKHSTRCSISRMALRQFENEFEANENVLPYYLDLLNHRDISNEIAIKFSVVHQSPQLLIISKEKCIHNTSHSDIDAGVIKNYL
ncbi:bacillithiol system redox-active protein YtxJ [Flavobacterium sp.]|uniref:bacillithiol system redox-active protein YtxJ n=1 Tax=Flavobacterium sp. TaxID=239 RepID=UPI00334204FE